MCVCITYNADVQGVLLSHKELKGKRQSQSQVLFTLVNAALVSAKTIIRDKPAEPEVWRSDGFVVLKVQVLSRNKSSWNVMFFCFILKHGPPTISVK